MKWFVRALAAIVCLLLGAELVLRYLPGLGDPPLLVIDPEIEYLAAPSRCYQRFGNSVCYNSASMRAQEPPRAGSGAKRYLVLGDSIVNGTALIDQGQLATSRLQTALGPQVWVGNISESSWGPANLAAYTRRFGWFDADLAVLVLSTHDLTDLPEFRADFGPDAPTTKPYFAIEEAIFRYGRRYVPLLERVSRQATPPRKIYADPETEGRAALAGLLGQMKANSRSAYVVLHPTVGELAAGPTPEKRAEIEEIMRAGLQYVDVAKSKTWSKAFYRDDIHLNADGQAALAEILLCLWKTPGPACAG